MEIIKRSRDRNGGSGMQPPPQALGGAGMNWGGHFLMSDASVVQMYQSTNLMRGGQRRNPKGMVAMMAKRTYALWMPGGSKNQ